MAEGREAGRETRSRGGRTGRGQREGCLCMLVQAYARRARGMARAQHPIRAAAQLVRRGRLREREEGRRRASSGRRGRACSVPRFRKAERDQDIRHEPRLRHGRTGHRLCRARRLLQEPRSVLLSCGGQCPFRGVCRGRLGNPLVAKQECHVALQGAVARGLRNRACGERMGGFWPRPRDQGACERARRRATREDMAEEGRAQGRRKHRRFRVRLG